LKALNLPAKLIEPRLGRAQRPLIIEITFGRTDLPYLSCELVLSGFFSAQIPPRTSALKIPPSYIEVSATEQSRNLSYEERIGPRLGRLRSPVK